MPRLIPLTLVTGFLGSGKTTLLRNLALRYRRHKIAYAVNEWATVTIDSRLLGETALPVSALPGGSIFCTCLSGGFALELVSLLARHDEPGSPLEAVVVEASGVANPGAIQSLLTDTNLDRVYRLANVVSVIDPGTFETLLDTLPNIAAQVAASDVALINKADLYGEPRLVRVEEAVQRIQPGIRLRRTVQCDVEIDVLDQTNAHVTGGKLVDCADPAFVATCLRVEAEVDIASLETLLRELGATIYRAKGFLRVAGRMRYVDSACGTVNVLPAPADAAPDFVLIHGPESASAAHKVAEMLGVGTQDT
ncbi:MAG: GTP-binding protein [Candidatus Hydrogenedentes bacterium]|nr:GTP-binding protein [Candidatus Hydrogenedentota bacterium]